jgi:UV DNA damage endonuclease
MVRYFGYACMNVTKKLTTSHTLRQNNFSFELWMSKCLLNLQHLYEMLMDCNLGNLHIFRIGSGLIPFATHTLTDNYNWQSIFSQQFKFIADYIKQTGIRITMHPDHFVVLNSTNQSIYEKSVKDLQYHADIMDLLELDLTCKMQIHTGGVYGNKQESLNRWIERYHILPDSIKRRLVLENDDRVYSFQDVMYIHNNTGVPILFDTLHHECLNTDGSSHQTAFQIAIKTWKDVDGVPLVDYSSQQYGEKLGKHTDTIDLNHFINMRAILDSIIPEYDVILEIKDKEISAYKLKSYLSEYKILACNEISQKLCSGEIVSVEWKYFSWTKNAFGYFRTNNNTIYVVELYYDKENNQIFPAN